MPEYRSKTSTHGRNMAGARALWRATGVMETNFGKPIIAVTNSFIRSLKIISPLCWCCSELDHSRGHSTPKNQR